jgi:hypothetical protein
MTPDAALVIYNQITAGAAPRTRTGAPIPWPLTPKVRGDVVRFLAWCVEHQVDPERWMRARMDSVGHRFRVAPDKLISPKFLVAFKRWGDGHQAERQGQAAMVADTVDDTPRSGGELVELAEAVKMRLRAEPEVCMLSWSVTLGCNPRSQWCARCPMIGACWAMLDDATRAARSAG